MPSRKRLCEVLLGEELGIVRIEGIKAATAVDFIAEERFDRDRAQSE
jgi:hypothetical protein